ncbi:MAG: NADPH-dependent reductase [Chlorobi bacterium]|nr:NADPH-dependent reductase [Chlorobiota bacterium]
MVLNIPILLGSSRNGRKSVHVARYLLEKLQSRKMVDTRLLDLAEYDFPIMEERYVDMSPPPDGLREFAETIAGADGLLIVAPEYKSGYPAVLKNALDYLAPNIFNRRPVAICTVSAGGFGGINCLSQLRLVCLAMGGVPIPGALPISNVNEWFGDDGVPLNPRLDDRSRGVIDELLWYAAALAAHRSVSEQG